MSNPLPIVQLTVTGYLALTKDATSVVQACLAGYLLLIPCRLNSQERTSVVKSCSIFVYEEEMSGIKRWADGLTWSPSRILGDFLIYRELDDRLASKGNKRKPQGRGRVCPSSQPTTADQRQQHFNK